MKGFAMQETSFPVITLIVDDASTDGEPDIIRKFLVDNFMKPFRQEETDDYHLLCASHKTNPNCTFVALFLKYNHYSIKKDKFAYLSEWLNNAKYYALCEGDDFWINPEKLQKQVDYLEQHENCALCYCDSKIVNKESNEIVFRKVNRRSGECAKSLILDGNYLITAGVCYRSMYENEWYDILKSIPFPLLLDDKPHWIFLSSKGSFFYIPEKLVAYRKLEESASHTRDYEKAMLYSDNVRDINLYFNKLFNVGVSERQIKSNAQVHRIRCAAPIGWKVYFREIGINIRKSPLLIFNFNFWKAIAIKMVSTFK